MSTEIEDKLQQILDEKNSKIIPENIKTGVEIFGVKGTHAGSYNDYFKLDNYISVPSSYGPIQRWIKKFPLPIYVQNGLHSMMFAGCDSLEEVEFKTDTGSGDNVVIPCINGAYGAFADCYNLKKLPPLDFSHINQYAYFGNMFCGCQNLEEITINGTFIPNSDKESQYSGANMDYYNGMGLVTKSVANMFRSCQKLETINGSISLSNSSNYGICADMMFAYCRKLKHSPVIDYSGVKYMYGMYWDCVALEDLDLTTVNLNNFRASYNYDDFLKNVNPNCEITCHADLASVIRSKYPNQFNIIVV